MFVGVFEADLTQFLHSSQRHFLAYASMFLDVVEGSVAATLAGSTDYRVLQRSPEPVRSVRHARSARSFTAFETLSLGRAIRP